MYLGDAWILHLLPILTAYDLPRLTDFHYLHIPPSSTTFRVREELFQVGEEIFVGRHLPAVWKGHCHCLVKVPAT